MTVCGFCGGPRCGWRRAAAGVAVVALLLVALWARAARPAPVPREGFYTEYAVEEPTRSYVPFCGTVPLGPWGAAPWAEVPPLPEIDWPPM